MKQEIRELRAALQEARSLGQSNRHMEARAVLKKAYGHARAAGISSPELVWSLAVNCDYAGQPEEALGFILEVARLDPLSGSCAESAQIIAAHVREALSDPGRDPSDPATATSYAQLVELGEADTRTHVAMARHLAATGHAAWALEVLEAVVVLEPGFTDAWKELSAVGHRIGRTDLVRKASAALVGLGKDEQHGAATVSGTAQA
jgi:hypothetical protein